MKRVVLITLALATLAGCQMTNQKAEIARPAPPAGSTTARAALLDAKQHVQQQDVRPSNFETRCHPTNGNLHCQTTSN